MSDFKSSEKIEGEGLTLAFEGNIDEDVKFPPVDASKFKVVTIDLMKVKTINSVGIREWLGWIKPIAEKAKIIFTNCPKALVFQMNMVEGFLPKGGSVKTFFVPFYCEKCDKEENVLFTLGKEVALEGGNPKINFDVKASGLCKESACEMEMDATEAKYFQFLKKLA